MTGATTYAAAPPVGTAVDIAAAVRRGDRSAREVVDAHLARIAEREPELHAFNLVLADEARAAADALDRPVAAGEDPGPLAGVPVALKDNLCTRGIATTCSSKILEGWRPPYDATVVDRLRRRRRHRRRQDQPRRVRHGQLDRELGLRPHPQPPRHRPGCPADRRGAAPPPWPPASPRWRSAPTPAARSASPPRCAGWSG